MLTLAKRLKSVTTTIIFVNHPFPRSSTEGTVLYATLWSLLLERQNLLI